MEPLGTLVLTAWRKLATLKTFGRLDSADDPRHFRHLVPLPCHLVHPQIPSTQDATVFEIAMQNLEAQRLPHRNHTRLQVDPRAAYLVLAPCTELEVFVTVIVPFS